MFNKIASYGKGRSEIFPLYLSICYFLLAKDNETLNYCSRSPSGEFHTFSNYRENLKIMDKERSLEV